MRPSRSANPQRTGLRRGVWAVIKHTTGADLPLRTGRSVVADATAAWRRLLPPTATVSPPRDFADLGLTEAQCAAIRRRCRWALATVLAGIALSVILLLGTLWQGNPVGTLGALGGLLIAGALGLRYSLVSAQVRQRRLLTFAEWAREPRQWWPR